MQLEHRETDHVDGEQRPDDGSPERVAPARPSDPDLEQRGPGLALSLSLRFL
jgi:hypothetical protein